MIDHYCERTDPGFWSEPANALTNLAFIIAGLLAISVLRKSSSSPLYMWVLAGLMVLIGIGSFLFHTLATSLTALADALPIYAFQLVFLWCYPRFALNLERWQVAGLFVLYLGATVASARVPVSLNGSEMYFPAILMMGLYAALAARAGIAGWPLLAVGAALFTVSLTARTVDEWLCAGWPLGTHFIWHTLNGFVLYLSWLSLNRGRSR